MTVSELYELKRKFLDLDIAKPCIVTSEYILLERFVDYLANWIYEKEQHRRL